MTEPSKNLNYEEYQRNHLALTEILGDIQEMLLRANTIQTKMLSFEKMNKSHYISMFNIQEITRKSLGYSGLNDSVGALFHEIKKDYIKNCIATYQVRSGGGEMIHVPTALIDVIITCAIDDSNFAFTNAENITCLISWLFEKHEVFEMALAVIRGTIIDYRYGWKLEVERVDLSLKNITRTRIKSELSSVNVDLDDIRKISAFCNSYYANFLKEESSNKTGNLLEIEEYEKGTQKITFSEDGLKWINSPTVSQWDAKVDWRKSDNS